MSASFFNPDFAVGIVMKGKGNKDKRLSRYFGRKPDELC
jgi:hypothetical protein